MARNGGVILTRMILPSMVSTNPTSTFADVKHGGCCTCFVRGVYCCRCTPRTLAISVLLLILIGLAGAFMAFILQVAETSYAPVLMGFTSSNILASRRKDYALALVISPTIDDPWLLIDVKLMTSSTWQHTPLLFHTDIDDSPTCIISKPFCFLICCCCCIMKYHFDTYV